MMTPTHYRVAGVDPGATTGLVALAVDSTRPHDVERARWIGSTSIDAGSSTKLTRAAVHARLFDRARNQFLQWGVVSVALEEPLDAMPKWSGRGERRETMFGLGRYYGLVLAAAQACRASVASYPVTTDPSKGRVGWMPTHPGGANKRLTMTAPREQTLDTLHQFSLALRARPHNGLAITNPPRLPDDELMALGVLLYHLTRQPLKRL
jgi:hypothetical protein